MESGQLTAGPLEPLLDQPQAPPGRGTQGFAVFVINLDGSDDRLAHMGDELGRAGLTFERVPGVRGTDVPDPLRPYFFDAAGKLASPLKLGEIGCHAAHLAACRRVLDSGAQAALVLEDDAQLCEGFADLIESLLARLPPGWDAVRLSNPPKRAYVPLGSLDKEHRLVRYSKIPNCAIAYLLSASGARKMLRPGLRDLEADEFMRRPWLNGLDTYGVVPPPVGLASLGSMIDAIENRMAQVRPNPISNTLRKSDFGNLEARLRGDIAALGPARWVACALINAVDHGVRRISGRTIIHRCAEWLGTGSASLTRADRSAVGSSPRR